jgi:uracil-DNA glycosylase
MTEKEYFGDWFPLINLPTLTRVLDRLSKERDFVPKHEDVFKVFTKCSFKNLKVVFLGMDPYPQRGIATGIAFGNSADTAKDKYSPSLKVIYDSLIEYSEDLPYGFDCTLESWCSQGILMLNSSLTVTVNKPGSHYLIWHKFISELLLNISTNKPDTIFVLFGNKAQSFVPFLNSCKYFNCVHPSYCARKNELLPNIFSEVNNILKEKNIFIKWI